MTDADRADADTVVPMPVAPYGIEIDLEPWREFPHLIIDAAAGVGVRQSFATLRPDWSVTVSLHATKRSGCPRVDQLWVLWREGHGTYWHKRQNVGAHRGLRTRSS